MLYLPGNNSRIHKFAAQGYPLGMMFSPKGYRNPLDRPYAVDNGGFYDPKLGQVWQGEKLLPPFRAMLRRVVAELPPPLFGSVPDVPYDMKRSRKWSAWQRDKLRRDHPGLKLAVVLQEGATDDDLDGYDWAFVGGGDDWKWSTSRRWVETAHARGMPCHIGRVNTWKPLQHCIDIGADTADGTGIWRGDRQQLRKALSALVQPGLHGQRKVAGFI